MSALERIAELHTAQTRKAVDITPYVVGCAQCFKPWPCPTRRLCDEGGAERDKIAHYLAGVIEGIEAARDAARADADRLAAAVRVLLVVQTKLREKTLDSDGVARFEGFTWTTAFDALCAALAAHDAARTEEPTVGDDLAVLAVAERAQVIEWLRTHHDGFANDGRWMHVGNVLRRLCLAAPGDDTAHDAARTKEGP